MRQILLLLACSAMLFGQSTRIVRPKEIHLRGFDLDGRQVDIEADELEARCFQHELDHLDGRLLFELLDRDQRKEAMRELRRRAEAPGRPVG